MSVLVLHYEMSEENCLSQYQVSTENNNNNDGGELLHTLIQTDGDNQVVHQQPLHILQTADCAHILNAETIQTLDGIVIAVAAPATTNVEDPGNSLTFNFSNELSTISSKVWQVVPANDSADVTHIIAVGQRDDNTTHDDDCELNNELDSNSILTSDTLASMLLANPLSSRSLPSDAPSWALKLRDCEAIGDSYRGWVASESELDLILTFHKQQTQSFWGTRQSPSVQRHSTRLMWKSQYVPFDGIPFINSGSRATVMECQYGPRRRGHLVKKQADNKDGFKQTCPARIYIKRVCKFPEFMVDTNTDRKNFRAAMDKAFQELKLRGFEGHGEERWYVQLPSAAAHEFHEAGKAPAKAAPKYTSSTEELPYHFISSNTRLHPKISEKIRELVQKGETRVYAVRKQLRKFVERNMFDDTEHIPERHNLSYFPTVHDIQNHVYQAIKDLESGKLKNLAADLLNVNSGSDNEGENSSESASVVPDETTSEMSYEPQSEMITVTLMQPPQSENTVISRVETQMSDGTLQISTTLSPETAQLLSRLNPNIFGNSILQDPLLSLSNETPQSIEDKEGNSSSHDDDGTITVTMSEGGEILQVENNCASSPTLPD